MKIQADASRHELKDALLRRSAEIREAVTARVASIGGHDHSGNDAEYRAGLRAAIDAAISYTVVAAADGDRQAPVPTAIVAQAGLAARRGIPMETMLRRYLAGHAVVGDFVLAEAERMGLAAGVIRWVLRSQAARTDQVVTTITGTYVHETTLAARVPAVDLTAQRVRRLLAGELVDKDALHYEFDLWHMGLVTGPGAEIPVGRIKAIAAADLVVRGADSFQIWLGFREKPDAGLIAAKLSALLPRGIRAGIGEPGRGLSGWRITHQQGREALSVALRERTTIARYADIALLACAMKDDLFISSLIALYVTPFTDSRARLEIIGKTLVAYLGADRNVTSAAAALGLSRNTVTKRIQTVEETIGSLSSSRLEEAVLAFRLAELSGVTDPVQQAGLPSSSSLSAHSDTSHLVGN